MALTCGIQALYDNNREVWFASGLRSAGQQLENRRCLWDDVTRMPHDQDHNLTKKVMYTALSGDLSPAVFYRSEQP